MRIVTIIIKGRGKGNLLEGHGRDERYLGSLCCRVLVGDMYEDDYAFFEEWIYEVNAYNIVFEGMGKLFGERLRNGRYYEIAKEYVYFTDMLKSLERKKKKTPDGNGFAKIKCRERIAELEKQSLMKLTMQHR